MEHIIGNSFKLEDTVVTLGKFDGVHLGHKELIDNVLQTKGLKKVLFTFDVNPLNILSDKDMKTIYTKEERMLFLEKIGLDYIIDFPFTKETIETDAESFIKNIIKDKLGAKKIVVGSDFRFGKNRLGDTDLLKKRSEQYGYELVVVEKKIMYGEEISSTRIRELIKNGDVKTAGELLGRPFSIYGKIIHGRQLGRTIGLPTINQEIKAEKLLARFGVYVSDTELNGNVYRGLTNIGIKPTVADNDEVSVETWLIGMDEEVYGSFAKVNILDFVRDEKKFNSLSELKEQINIDIEKVRQYR